MASQVVRPVALLAVLGLLLAGCSSPAAQEQLKLADGTTLDLEGNVSATTGAIAGVVVDEAIRPVVGARITGLATTFNVTTDDNGVFQVGDLAPGFVAFTVEAPGFLTIQSSVDVVAGQVTKSKVQLVTDTSPQPYHVTYALDGFMQAWGGIGQFVVEIFLEGGSGLCNCRLRVQPEANLSSMVVESYWEHSLPDPAGLAEYYLSVEEVGPDGFLETQYCFSPCRMHLEADAVDYLGGEIEARQDGADFWPSYNQKINLYITLFYHGSAPTDWTLDGA